MTIRLAFPVPTSPALSPVTGTLVLALPGQAASMAITGTSLIKTLLKSGFADCCQLVTMSGQVLRDTLIKALRLLVDRVLGPLISAGDAARSILACVRNPDVKGCSASVKQTSDLVNSLVNDGGGFDYAGAVTLAVTSIVKEAGQRFANTLINMIEAQIDSLIATLRNAVCGHCAGGGAKPPSKQTVVNSMHATSAAMLLSTRAVTSMPPGVAMPANLRAPRPGVLVPPVLPVWPKFAAVGGALAVTLGAGWFFFRKAGKA